MLLRPQIFKFCVKAHQSNLDVLYEMSKKAKTPFFTIQSHHIEIINDPLQFYLALHREAKKAIHRVGISSLYLGTGSLQRFLFKSIATRVKNVPSLNATMVFDFNRSSREEKGESSMQMMSHYLDSETQKRFKISFNKQSNSRFKLFGEVSGVHHQKIALFDDTIIIGGANLSFNYFVNRKDRYFKLQQCPQLADYLYQYLQVLGENCQQFDQGNTKKTESNLLSHYKLWKFSYSPEQYKQIFQDQQVQLDKKAKQKAQQAARFIKFETKKKIPKDRNIILAEILGSDIKQYEVVPQQERKQRVERTREKLFTVGDENDVGNCIMDIQQLKEQNQVTEVGEKVYIFPFIQFPAVKETIEPQVLSSLLKNSIANKIPVRISSGYMNFTPQILQILAQSQKPTEVLCSAPEANSFYRAGTFKKYIPFFYRNFEGMILSKWPQKFKIKQFFNGQWSFHAKGIWIKQAQNSYVTVVGSSNYNRRSKQRDSQLQLYLYSTCPNFNARLDKEWANIEKDCKQITIGAIKQDKEIKYNAFFNLMSKFFSRFL